MPPCILYILPISSVIGISSSSRMMLAGEKQVYWGSNCAGVTPPPTYSTWSDRRLDPDIGDRPGTNIGSHGTAELCSVELFDH